MDVVRDAFSSDESDTDSMPCLDGDEQEEEFCFPTSAPTKDLFSEERFKSAEEALKDIKEKHGVCIKTLCHRLQLDTLGFIRFINFVRGKKLSPADVLALQLGDAGSKFGGDEWMKPVLDDDPLLMLDPEDFDDMEPSDATSAPADATTETHVNLLRSEYATMQQTLDLLKRKLRERDGEMEQLLEDMGRMKVTAQHLVEGDSAVVVPKTNKASNGGVTSVAESRTEAEDQSYAGSYAHFGIHHDMLSDRVRTEGYRDAIALNAAGTISGRHVLDLGCGTSILSMFSAKLGKAASVTAVDMSDIIDHARDIVIENGLSDQIQLVKGRLENVDLPRQKFDVIVSEWMGYFLLFEGMLDSVIAARDKYLAPGGRVLPNRCTMHLVAISDDERYDQTVDYWKDVYGFKMSCMKAPVLTEASVEVVPSRFIASSHALVHSLDMEKCSVKDTQFETDFELKAEKDCDITAIAGYFDTFFDLPDEATMFTTGPHGKPTHWKQTLFYLAEKKSVKAGQTIKGHIKCTRPKYDARAIKVNITLDGLRQKYAVE